MCNIVSLNSKLSKLRHDGCITEEDYQQLKELVLRGRAFEQVKWERDIAFEQLKELGTQFGERTELAIRRIKNIVIEEMKKENK